MRNARMHALCIRKIEGGGGVYSFQTSLGKRVHRDLYRSRSREGGLMERAGGALF